jgi:hypothetical protein
MTDQRNRYSHNLGDELVALARTLEPIVHDYGESITVEAVRLAAAYLKIGKAVPHSKSRTGPKPAESLPFYAWLYVEARVRGGRGHRTAHGVARALFVGQSHVIVCGGDNPLIVNSARRLDNLHSQFKQSLVRMAPARRRTFERLADRAAHIHRVSRK